MFKLAKFNLQRLAVSPYLLTAWVVAQTVFAVTFDGPLKAESNVNLFTFDLRVGTDFAAEVSSQRRGGMPVIDWAMLSVPSVAPVNLTCEFILEPLHDRRVAVCDSDPDSEGAVLQASDDDPSFAIEQTGGISEILARHTFLRVTNGILANSGNTENRQPRAKQVERPGVCREHGPEAKAKMCSGLHGNMQRAAEMTVPLSAYPTMLGYTKVVTECNNDKVMFYTDPAMRFEWSEKRTWPDQLLDIRLLTLKTALVYKSRMFLAVLDGWTA